MTPPSALKVAPVMMTVLPASFPIGIIVLYLFLVGETGFLTRYSEIPV